MNYPLSGIRLTLNEELDYVFSRNKPANRHPSLCAICVQIDVILMTQWPEKIKNTPPYVGQIYEKWLYIRGRPPCCLGSMGVNFSHTKDSEG